MYKISRSSRESLTTLASDIFSDAPVQIIDTSLGRSIDPHILPNNARNKFRQTLAEYEYMMAKMQSGGEISDGLPTFPMQSIVVRHEQAVVPNGTLVVNGLYVSKIMQWAFDGPVTIGNEQFDLHKEDKGLTVAVSCSHGTYSHGIRFDVPPFGNEISAIDDQVNRTEPPASCTPEITHKSVKPLDFIRGTLLAVKLQREASRSNDRTFSI